MAGQWCDLTRLLLLVLLAATQASPHFVRLILAQPASVSASRAPARGASDLLPVSDPGKGRRSSNGLSGGEEMEVDCEQTRQRLLSADANSIHFDTRQAKTVIIPKPVQSIKWDEEGGSGKPASSVRVDLIHRDARESPMRSEGAGYAQRMKAAIVRSLSREQIILGTDFRGKMSSDQVDAETTSAATTANNSVVVPVAAGIGEYVMPLAVGSPQQNFTTILDTGSDLVWLQCKPCFHCFSQESPYFDPLLSSSYKNLNCISSLCQDLPKKRCGFASCVYTYEYGDQSFTAGDFSSDTVTLPSTSGGSFKVASLGFGCGHNNHGSFSGAGGLVGLGQGPLSFSSQLSSMVTNKFSYCMVSLDESETTTSPLFFGDAAEPQADGVRYTPILKNRFHPTYYYVGLSGISVGGQRLNIPNSTFDLGVGGIGGMVFDSGTTLTMLPPAAYNLVLEAFDEWMQDLPKVFDINSGLDLCYDVSGLQSVEVPTFTFHFLDADYDVPAGNTFILVDEVGTLCLALQMSSILAIFGNIQQQNFQIIYDRQNSRIGFVPVQCREL